MDKRRKTDSKTGRQTVVHSSTRKESARYCVEAHEEEEEAVLEAKRESDVKIDTQIEKRITEMSKDCLTGSGQINAKWTEKVTQGRKTSHRIISKIKSNSIFILHVS